MANKKKSKPVAQAKVEVTAEPVEPSVAPLPDVDQAQIDADIQAEAGTKVIADAEAQEHAEKAAKDNPDAQAKAKAAKAAKAKKEADAKDAAAAKTKADIEAKARALAEANKVPAMRTRTAKGQDRYFRGGQPHSKQWTHFAADVFTQEQATKVLNDPHLRVELVDED